MSNTERWMKLQFFAEGASGGDGGGEASSTGDEAPAAAGQERTLESLGVPRAKAEKHRARTGAKQNAQPQAAQTAAAQAEPTERAAAAEATSQQNQPAKLSFEELLKDEEYSKAMQETVTKAINADRKRNGNAEAAEQLADLKPMLDMLCSRYGQTEGKPDYKKLAEAVSSDKRFYESKAAELGTSTQVAMEFERLQRESAQRKQADEENRKQQEYDQRMANLRQQGEELKKQFPNFDLDTEMQNPVFRKMVGPYMNLPLRQVYTALHHDEIVEASKQAAAQQMAASYANSIKAGRMPAENGRGGQSGGAPAAKEYGQMTRAEREQFKEHIRREAAYGRKVPLR